MSVFTKYLIDIISKYYNKPYQDLNEDCTLYRNINGRDYTVYRYNHGLVYGVRQAFLAKSIIYLYINRDNDFGKWLRYNCKNDINFVRKVMFASAFQRIGRESEGSSQSLGKMYLKYEMDDMKYFSYEAANSPLFHNHEIDMYKNAIMWESSQKSYLKNILHAAHLLDLRRIPSFDSQRIKDQVKKTLLGTSLKDRDIVEDLFDISGLFIDATGDRDMMKNKQYFDDRFFILTNNSKLLAQVMNDSLF